MMGSPLSRSYIYSNTTHITIRPAITVPGPIKETLPTTLKIHWSFSLNHKRGTTRTCNTNPRPCVLPMPPSACFPKDPASALPDRQCDILGPVG